MAAPRAGASPAAGPLHRKIAKKSGSFHHGDLRWALLEAASQQLEKEGPLGVCLRGAARLAGVSHAAPYRHFADKDAILAALAERGLTELGDRMQAARRAAPGPAEALRALGRTYVEMAAQKPHLFRLMFGPEVADKRRCPAVRAAGERAFRLVVEAIEEAQHAGVVRAGSAADLALVQWSAVHGFAMLILDGRLGDELAGAGGAAALGERLAEQLRLGSAPR